MRDVTKIKRKEWTEIDKPESNIEFLTCNPDRGDYMAEYYKGKSGKLYKKLRNYDEPWSYWYVCIDI